MQELLNKIEKRELENKKKMKLEKIEEMFFMEDCAKDELINAKTDREEIKARKLLKTISKRFEKLYIPTPIENV